ATPCGQSKGARARAGKLKGISMTVDLMSFARAVANGDIRVIDLTQTLSQEFPPIVLPPELGKCAPSGLGGVLPTADGGRLGNGTTLVSASILERTSTRRSTGFPARICRTTQSIRSTSRSSSRRLP